MTSCHSPTDRLGILKGHTRSVLCCKAVAAQNLLVTGGEVSSVPVTVSGYYCAGCYRVSLRALLDESFACSQDGLVCTYDLRSQALTARIRVSHEEAVPSLLISSARQDCVRASAGCDLFELDLRKVCVMLVYTVIALLHKSWHCILLCPTKSVNRYVSWVCHELLVFCRETQKAVFGSRHAQPPRSISLLLVLRATC